MGEIICKQKRKARKIYLAATNLTLTLFPRGSIRFNFKFKDTSLTVNTLLPDFNRSKLKAINKLIIR